MGKIKVDKNVFDKLILTDDNIGDKYDLMEGVFVTKQEARKDKIDSLLSDKETDRMLITFGGKSIIDGGYFFDLDLDDPYNNVVDLLNQRFGKVQIVTQLEDNIPNRGS